MTDEDQQYTLDAEVYTQAVFQDETSGQWFTDYALTQLNAASELEFFKEQQETATAGWVMSNGKRAGCNEKQAVLCDFGLSPRGSLCPWE